MRSIACLFACADSPFRRQSTISKSLLKTSLKAGAILSLLLFVFAGGALGQAQTIGAVPGFQGGFENQVFATGTLFSATPTTAYTVSNLNATLTRETGAGVMRTGSNCGSFFVSSSSSNAAYTPSGTGVTSAGTYIVQYYLKTSGTSRSVVYALSCTSTTFGTETAGTASGTSSSWVKFTQTVTAGTGTTGDGLLKFRLGSTTTTGQRIYFDDICVYPSTNGVDVTSPSAATSPTVTPSNGSLTVSWTGGSDAGADASGVGGYIVVRGTADPTTAPLVNGIYGVGNTVAASQTVVYVGTGTSFQDNALTNGTQYFYRIYTADKAFNYSSALTCNGTPVAATNYYNTSGSDLTDVNNWSTNTNGVGGSHPANFTTGNVFYNITNTTVTPTISTGWTVSGTSSKVILGDGSIANTFTIPSGASLTGTIDIANVAALTISNTTNPTLGTIGSTSTVIFDGSSAQTIPSTTYGNLTLNNSAGGSLAGAITVAGTMTITAGTLDVTSANNYGVTLQGNFVNNGTFTPQAGTVTFNGTTTISGSSTTQFKNITINSTKTLTGPSSATMNVSGNWVNNGTFTHNNSTILFNGTSTISGSGTQAFSSVTINTSNTLTGPATSGAWSVAGNFTNNGTFTNNTSILTFNGTANQIFSGSAATTAFTTIVLNNTGTSPTNVVDFQSVFTMTAATTTATLTITAGVFKLSSASSITPFGNTNTTLGTNTGIVLNHASATVAWGGASSLLLTSGGSLTMLNGTMTISNSLSAGNRLDVASGATLTLTGGTLNVNGRFQANASGTTLINGGTLNIPSGVTLSNASNGMFHIFASHSFTMSSGNVNVRSKNTNQAFADITIVTGTISGGTISVSNTTVSVNSTPSIYDFTVVNNGGTAIASLVTNPLLVSHNLTITSGTLQANSLGISVGGDWSNSGTFTPGTQTVTFNGGSAQQYTQTSGSFSSVTLNNSNGLTLNSAMTVAGTLTLSSGKMTIGANNLTLASTVSGTFGQAATSYIVAVGAGKVLIQNIGTTYTGDVLFPVGSSSSSYTPLVVNTGNTGLTNTFGVSVTAAPVGGTVAANSVQVSWPMSHTVGTDAAVVKVQWNATAPQTGDEGSAFTRASCQVVNYNGALNPVGTIGAASTAATDIYTQSSVVTFNAFNTIGVTNGVTINTYYNVASSDITNVANWGTSTNGSGTNPTDFITDNQIFYISNTGATMSAPWAVSGTGSAINVGDGTNTVTFAQTDVVTGAINVSNHGTLQIVTATIPTFGTLATGSTIDYAGTSQAITATPTYSNLTLSGTATTFPSGSVVIGGTFTPGSITTATQGTVNYSGTTQAIAAFNYNNLTLSGTGTTFPAGTVGIAATFTPGSITTASQGTIEYNGSSSQSILAFSYKNLSSSNSGARTLASSGTVGIAGTFVPGSNAYTITGSTVNFNGSGSSQTIPAFAFNNLTCSNSSGTTIGSGSTVSFAGTSTTALNLSAGTLTVDGTLENKAVAATTAGNATTTGTLSFSSTGIYKLSDAPGSLTGVSFIPTATWNSGSTLYIAIGASTAGDYSGLYGVKQTFSNVTINSPSFDGKMLISSQTNASTAPFLAISGTLNVISTGSGTGLQLINTSKNNNQLAVGAYTQSGGNVYLINSASSAATRTVTVAGSVSITGGLFSLNTTGNNTSGNNGTLTIGGDLTIGSGATLAKEAAGANATGFIQFIAATGDQTFTNNGTFSGAADITLNKASGNLLLGSNLTVNGTVALTAGSFDISTYALTLKSTVSRTAGTIDSDNGTLILNGTAAQNIPASTILGGAIKNLTLNNSTGATLNGAHTIGTAITLTSGTLTASALTIADHTLITRTATAATLGSVPTFAGDVDITYNNGSTISTANEMPTGGSALRNLTLSNGSVNLAASATVNGIATLASGTLGVGTNTLTLNGDVTPTSGTISTSTTGTVNYNNGSSGQNVLAVNYGNLGLNGGSKTLAAGTTGIAGTFTNNAGSSHTVTGTTINFNGSGAQSIPSFNYENLQTNTGGTKTLAGSMNIGGDVSIGNGTVLASGNNNVGILGNWTEAGTGAFSPGTGTVSFYGTGAQTVTSAAQGQFYDLSISKASGNFDAASLVNVANRLQLEQGSVTNGSNIVMASGAKIVRETGSLDAAPNFAGIVDLEYANSGSMSSGDEVPATDIVRNVTVNGGGTVTLGRAVKVNGSLTLNSGIIDLDVFDMTANAGSVGAGSTTSYIRTSTTGALKIKSITSSPQNFPIGNSTYNPMDLSSGTTQDWSVRVEDALGNLGSFSGNAAKAVSRQWDITPATVNPVPVPGATVTFYYNDGDPTQVGGSFNTANDMKVWHYGPDGWVSVSGAITPGGTPGSMRTVTVSGITYFSPFGVGDVGAALPVSLLSFSGKRVNTTNELKWKTASESNNRGFGIERSADGANFTQVAFVNSRATAGNSSSDLQYNYNDQIAAGTKWYYRLKQTDLDGHFKYSAVVLIKTDKSGLLTIDGIFPNPVKGAAQVRVQAGAQGGAVVLQLTDMTGRMVKVMNVSADAGSSTTVSVDLTGLAAGQYYLKAVETDGTVSETVTVVKQ
jgi:hypothetical protein